MLRRFKAIFSIPVKRQLFKVGLKGQFTPPVGQVDMGDLNRLMPIARNYGYQRGEPIDRYYIEEFLRENQSLIKGHVLEIGDDGYTRGFGGTKVLKSDVLHLNNSNQKATIIGDLTHLPQIKDNTFDCIILTQTIQFIYDYQEALRTCFRILKPGGALLLTAPGIAPLDDNEWHSLYYWSFTAGGVQKLLKETFIGSDIHVKNYGNILAATSFLNGLCREELTKKQLDHHDQFIQMIAVGRAIKK